MGFLKIGSGGGIAFALLFDIIAISTPGWIYVESGNTTWAQGLFQNFSDGIEADVTKGDAERVAIAFNVMADVILVCAMAALCFAGGKGDNEVIGKVGGVLAFVGAYPARNISTYASHITPAWLCEGVYTCLCVLVYFQVTLIYPRAIFKRAGIFIMIGMASYTGMYIDFVSGDQVAWGYSFAFGWLAFTISILAAPVAFVDRD